MFAPSKSRLRSGLIPEEDHRMQKFFLWHETNISYSLVSSALSQHASLSILSLVRLFAMAVSIDISYKPLLACAHECKPNLVVLWPMGQSKYMTSHLFSWVVSARSYRYAAIDSSQIRSNSGGRISVNNHSKCYSKTRIYFKCHKCTCIRSKNIF